MKVDETEFPLRGVSILVGASEMKLWQQSVTDAVTETHKASHGSPREGQASFFWKVQERLSCYIKVLKTTSDITDY